ncbi:S8 family peptidase [Hydrogenophaga sp. RWCD_12]|uniref:S8 family peptidase n=1 Tax=Hydrogenophaga sp. RWCD_12 TaxID=3391190 RepID=UPI003984F7E8
MNRQLTFRAAALLHALLAFFFCFTAVTPHAAEQAKPPRIFAKAATDSPKVRGIIIKYREGTTLTKSLSSQYAGQNAAGLGFTKASEAANRQGISLAFEKSLATGGHLLRQSVALKPAQLRQMIQEIARDPAVEYVEPDGIRRPMGIPNDAYFLSQWHLQNVTGGINMPGAWDFANGSGVRVAVVDSGVSYHPDLTPNVIGGYDFISDPWMANDGNGRDADPSDPGDAVSAVDSYWECGDDYVEYPSTWHGTHVAGTVGAVTNNGVGVSGVAFGAKVVPIRVLGRCGGQVSDIAEAVIWAAGGSVAGVPANPYPAKVINVSLGGRDVCSATEQSAIDTVRGLGAVVVVSAGNDSDNTAYHSPAGCNGVITVAATTSSGAKASFSNFGSAVGLAAPGASILSTYNYGYWSPGLADYGYLGGTSMAAPHVSGVAALLLQLNPGFTPDQVAARLKLGSTPFAGACAACGAGILNAYGALVPPTFAAGTVFRFYNLNTGMHLFTGTTVERDAILGSLPAYQYERAAFKVQPSAGSGSLPVYRFRNVTNGAYFFTISEAEKNQVLGTPWYVLEGVAWWARSPASPGLGTIPLHRFRHLATGSHFYSYSAEEVASILTNLSQVYVYEGVAFYVWPL